MSNYKLNDKKQWKQCKQCNQYKSLTEYTVGKGVCKVCRSQKAKVQRTTKTSDTLSLSIRDNNETINYKTEIKPKIVFQTSKRKITIIIEDIDDSFYDKSIIVEDNNSSCDKSNLLTIAKCIHRKGLTECRLDPTVDEIQDILDNEELVESIAEDTGIHTDKIISILSENFLN